MDPQFAGVDAHIAHIKDDIAEIKTEQRRIDDRFDKKFDDITPRLDLLRDKIETSTAAGGKHLDDTVGVLTRRLETAEIRREDVRKEVMAHIETARKDVSNTIENRHSELSKRVDDAQREIAVVKESVANVKFWAYRFFVTQTAGIAVVIAHAFRLF